MSGTLNKVMLIGHTGDELKCIILKEEEVLDVSHWRPMNPTPIQATANELTLQNGITSC